MPNFYEWLAEERGVLGKASILHKEYKEILLDRIIERDLTPDDIIVLGKSETAIPMQELADRVIEKLEELF